MSVLIISFINYQRVFIKYCLNCATLSWFKVSEWTSCETFLRVLTYFTAFIKPKFSSFWVQLFVVYFLSLGCLPKPGLKVNTWYCSSGYWDEVSSGKGSHVCFLQWRLASVSHLNPHCSYMFAHAVPSVWNAIPAFTIHAETYICIYICSSICQGNW